MPHVITIKCIMCVQEKTELSNKPLRPRLSSTETSGDLCIAKKSEGRQKAGLLLPRGGSRHPMPSSGYGPDSQGRNLIAFSGPSLATGRIVRDEWR